MECIDDGMNVMFLDELPCILTAVSLIGLVADYYRKITSSHIPDYVLFLYSIRE